MGMIRQLAVLTQVYVVSVFVCVCVCVCWEKMKPPSAPPSAALYFLFL